MLSSFYGEFLGILMQVYILEQYLYRNGLIGWYSEGQLKKIELKKDEKYNLIEYIVYQ